MVETTLEAGQIYFTSQLPPKISLNEVEVETEKKKDKISYNKGSCIKVIMQ